MTDPNEVVRTYVDTWNATDASRRTSLLEDSWTHDVAYIDPMSAATGHEQISRLIAGIHEHFPGFAFKQLGKADGYAGAVRFAWSLGPADGEPPIKGSDVLELREGRIARVIGFLDQVPPT